LLGSESNHLHFSGPTGDNVLPVVAALHNLVHEQGYKDVILDVSKSGHLDSKFIRNTSWAHVIWPREYDARDDRNQLHLSAIKYSTAEELFAAVDRSIDVILRSVGGLDRGQLKAPEWSLNETTDNVRNYAESPMGGLVQVVTFPKKHLVELYVCDGGVAIPKTLGQGRPQLTDDVSALEQAIEEGVTRNPKANRREGWA
jgi:hypothetical protein